MQFIVYILYSDKFNKHYFGFTTDLQLRLKSHNEFGKDWTARYRPWKMIYTKEFENKIEAMKYEKWLKTGAGRVLKNYRINRIHIRRGGRQFKSASRYKGF